MKIMILLSLLLFFITCSSIIQANEIDKINDEQHFLNHEGQIVSIDGSYFRSKEGEFLICDKFSVYLVGFQIEKHKTGQVIQLTGIAKIYRTSESEKEWQERMANEPPSTHSGYIQKRLVLEAIK